MTAHATAFSDNVQRRVLTWLAEQTYSGGPALLPGEQARVGAISAPALRVTFNELEPIYRGTYSEGQAAYLMGLLITLDLWWPDASAEGVQSLYDPDRCASEIRHSLTLKTWTFQDYTADPQNPVAIADARIRVELPPRIIRLPAGEGMLRRQVQCTAEWIGRFPNAFAS